MNMKHIQTFESFLDESQRFVNFIYSREMTNINPIQLKDYQKEYKGGGDFETAIKFFGSNTKEILIWVAKTPDVINVIKDATHKYSISGLWTIDGNGYNLFIARD